MKTVWKFSLVISDEFTLDLPAGAIPLSFAAQHDQPCLWVLLDPDRQRFERRFRIAGTGHAIDDAQFEHRYIGTAQLANGDLVLHLFELVEREPQ